MSISIGTFLKDRSGDEFVVSNIELFLHNGTPGMLQVFIYCQGIMAVDGSRGTMGRACCLTPAQISQGIWKVVDKAEAIKRLSSKSGPDPESKVERDKKTKELFGEGSSKGN